MKKTLFACALLVSVAALGQPSNSNLAASMKENAFANSLAFFAKHDFANGLAQLAGGNLALAGSPEYVMESAGGLFAAAAHFHAHGDSATELGIVQLTVTELTLAETLFHSATPPAEKALEQEMLGYIAECYSGNLSAARRYYTQAVELSPQTGQAAQRLAMLLRRFGSNL